MIGYRCGAIGDYSGIGVARDARIAWKALDYEYRELGNRHTLQDVAGFLKVKPTNWPAVLAEFKRRYGDAKGIWLSTTKSHAKETYGEYGDPEKIPYNKEDIVIDAGDEIYVFDKSDPSLLDVWYIDSTGRRVLYSDQEYKERRKQYYRLGRPARTKPATVLGRMA